MEEEKTGTTWSDGEDGEDEITSDEMIPGLIENLVRGGSIELSKFIQ